MAVVVEGLTKSYGAERAVDDVSFSVPDGALFAFLGTNGAGKSTTIGCITTVLRPDAGRIRVGDDEVGRADEAIRRRIGVVFQGSLLDPLLSVRENLRLRAGFYGLSAARTATRIAEVAELIDLGGFLDRRYGRLSGGQRRRADIARALVHDPEVVFLDEPTTGLDPQSREQVWSAVQGLRRERGATIFLTTHYLAETEAADAVCIIDAGRIVAEGSPSALRERYSSSVLTLRTADPGRAREALTRSGLTADDDRETLVVPVPDSEHARRVLAELGGLVTDFEFRHGTMDDVFLALTQRRAER